ncbi:MAG TPA: surface-adhesin E family protein, partial [Burkholderiales bacterium]|nr:surface-adhesin E family protein [Burkholderiales bacterium]
FSQKAQVEYDCKQRRLRGLSLALHAGKMGDGKVIYADETPHEWEAVDAGTMNETFWKVACK